MTRRHAALRIVAGVLLLSQFLGRQARAQVCAQETGNTNLVGQSNVTLVIDPSVPDRIGSTLITSQANSWKNGCTGNTEGIPTFTATTGTGFGTGQTFNNGIYVTFNPGSGTPDPVPARS